MNLLFAKKRSIAPVIISYLFHPLLMPTYGVLIIFNSKSALSLLNFQGQMYVLSVVSGFTFLLPALILPSFYYLRWIGNFEVSERNERLFPLAITALIYYYTYTFLKDQYVLLFIALFVLAIAIILIILLFVNFFWKISLHAAGVGGICALSLILALKISPDNTMYFVASLIVAGLVAYARLYLREHSPSQIYAGFGLGFFVIFLLFFLM